MRASRYVVLAIPALITAGVVLLLSAAWFASVRGFMPAFAEWVSRVLAIPNMTGVPIVASIWLMFTAVRAFDREDMPWLMLEVPLLVLLILYGPEAAMKLAFAGTVHVCYVLVAARATWLISRYGYHGFVPVLAPFALVLAVFELFE